MIGPVGTIVWHKTRKLVGVVTLPAKGAVGITKTPVQFSEDTGVGTEIVPDAELEVVEKTYSVGYDLLLDDPAAVKDLVSKHPNLTTEQEGEVYIVGVSKDGELTLLPVR